MNLSKDMEAPLAAHTMEGPIDTQPELELQLASKSLGISSSKSTSLTGFASLVRLKDENSSGMATRGSKRIHINQLGAGTSTAGDTAKNQLLSQNLGAVSRKRWSFHTSVSSQSLATEKDHQQSKKLKALQPICSPNKRRKSCAPDLHQDSHIHAGSSSSLSRPLVADIGKKTVYEQSRISRHYLLATQQQSNSQRLHRRFSTGGMVAVSRERESDSAKLKRRQHQRYLDEYFSHVQQADKYELAYHEHFRIRRSKTNKEIPPPPDYFANVPDEILLRVFKYLPKPALASAANTSKRFLNVVQDETLWRRICVLNRVLLPEHLLTILSRKPVYLRMAKASIPDPEEVPSESDIETLANSSLLLYLDLSGAVISPLALELIMKVSPKLVKLSLEHLLVTKTILEAMMIFTSTIEVLNLTMCYDLDAKQFAKFLTRCKRLKELNIGCMKCEWSHEDLMDVVSSLPVTLQQFNISGFRTVLDNNHVKIIVNRCPNLIELDLSDSQELQGKSLEYVLYLTKLQHLGLSRCYGIEPPTYTILAGHKSLKYLDLFSLFKESSLRQLSSNLPGIELNKFPFSAIARPTVGNKRSSIWLQRVRD